MNYQIAAGLKGIRYTYTGGLTAHATQSIYILSGVTGLVAEQYIEGQSSMAVGKIKLVNGTAVSIEVLIGRFQVLETLKAYATCDLSGPISAFSGVTIVSATRLCLAEAHPLIVKATEIEIRFMKQHKLDFENTKTGKDGTDRRQSSKNNAIEYELQPESEALLYRYKRLTV